MIVGIGIDLVEVNRFDSWAAYTHAQLRTTLSEQEIVYCLSVPLKSAQRFAARFAAREAFFKAINAVAPELPFLTACRAIAVHHGPNNRPELVIDWLMLAPYVREEYTTHVSITHTDSIATVFVVIEKE